MSIPWAIGYTAVFHLCFFPTHSIKFARLFNVVEDWAEVLQIVSFVPLPYDMVLSLLFPRYGGAMPSQASSRPPEANCRSKSIPLDSLSVNKYIVAVA